ncbi:translation initiation factor IF-5A [Candidatus Woesearchaeota archaeon]|nr:translation initiation factor IF-5A [Candidatus Woesearchaeota archaeon]
MGDYKQTDVGSVKKGTTIEWEGAPCTVTSVETSKPGKHGHAKCRITAVGIIDGKKRVFVAPGHEKINIPLIEKKSAQILSVSNNKASVMDMESFETFELDIPEELKDQIKENVQVMYWTIMGQKVIKQVK